MNPIYDLIASAVPMHKHPVAYNTALKRGQVVQLSSGKVAAVSAGQTGAILGIVAEAHPGTADMLNPQSNATEVLIADSPSTMFTCAAPRITASGGSTTTVVCSGYATGADDELNGATLVLVSKAAASTNTDPVGTRYTVSDFVAATKTITISTAGGAVTSGDVFAVFFPLGNVKAQFDSAGTGLTLTGGTNAALPLKCVAHDYKREQLMLYPKLHTLANAAS